MFDYGLNVRSALEKAMMNPTIESFQQKISLCQCHLNFNTANMYSVEHGG